MPYPGILLKNKAEAKGNDTLHKKGSLSPAILKRLIPRVSAVVADTDHYRLVIDSLTVGPLGIL
jgi:hypothetical protein